MESLFEVGDIVYVQGKILSVEEQTNDVRYQVVTNIARFFCTEKLDKIRRSADSANMLNKSFNEGRTSYHDVLLKIHNMTEEQMDILFGYTSLDSIIENYDSDTILDLFSRWVMRMSLGVSDIVSYTPDPESGSVTYDCVIIHAMVKIGDNYTVVDDLTESQLSDPIILSSKLLALYDPVNKVFFNNVSINDVEPVGKKIDAHKYLDSMKADFNAVMREETDVLSVTNKKDINYDNYYNDED